MIRQLIGPMLYQAGQWYRSATSIIRTRNTSDRVVLGTTDQASADSALMSVDGGSNTVRSLVTRGITYVNGSIILQEQAANLTCSATTLQSSASSATTVGFYMKADKFVIAHICGANGVVNYLHINLDGLSCTWVQSSTAP